MTRAVIGMTSTMPDRAIVLPTKIVEQLVIFKEAKISGWIQLNFNAGDLQSWQQHEHHRIKE